MGLILKSPPKTLRSELSEKPPPESKTGHWVYPYGNLKTKLSLKSPATEDLSEINWVKRMLKQKQTFSVGLK